MQSHFGIYWITMATKGKPNEKASSSDRAVWSNDGPDTQFLLTWMTTQTKQQTF